MNVSNQRNDHTEIVKQGWGWGRFSIEQVPRDERGGWVGYPGDLCNDASPMDRHMPVKILPSQDFVGGKNTRGKGTIARDGLPNMVELHQI